MSKQLAGLVLREIKLPLHTPYKLSYRNYTEFEPIIVEAIGEDGVIGWGEGHISPGSSSETREGGWAFVKELSAKITGMSLADAKAEVTRRMAESKVAATSIITAIEMLQNHSILTVDADTRLPLLTPFNANDDEGIAREVEQRLASGFRTFKIKVGQDVEDDIRRFGVIQKYTAGRATLRVDANRAYSREDGIKFSSSINPEGVELFEQPCDSDDWDANAAVAAASNVPLMLDEPICALPDIERAATIKGVGFCKLKLKRFGGLDLLRESLDAVREHGMEPVLGDGLSSEICCWMEACVARHTIRNAGEFNGFLKPSDRLFANPLRFEDGDIVMPAGYWPKIDRDKLKEVEERQERYGETSPD
ncbi:hypothetical protein GH722_16920 [Alphaproteobacteria bacterium HT1-32]|nr:hypothetical protein [Alphaproteobacteria bacterium HT1-32]